MKVCADSPRKFPSLFVWQERLVATHNETSNLALKLLSIERLLSAANVTNMSSLTAVRTVVCHSTRSMSADINPPVQGGLHRRNLGANAAPLQK